MWDFFCGLVIYLSENNFNQLRKFEDIGGQSGAFVCIIAHGINSN